MVNPLVSVALETRGCSNNLCTSYILSGGLEMVIPWVPRGYNDHSMVIVHNVPSIQVDFTSPTMTSFNDSDCDTFGEAGILIGIRLCLARAPSDSGSIRAGMFSRTSLSASTNEKCTGIFVCNHGIENKTCEGQQQAPNITTEVTFYTLQSSIVAVRANHSIIRVTASTVCKLLHYNRAEIFKYTDRQSRNRYQF